MVLEEWMEQELERIDSFYLNWVRQNRSNLSMLMLDQTPEEWSKLVAQHKTIIEAEGNIPFIDITDCIMSYDPIPWDEFSEALCKVEIKELE